MPRYDQTVGGRSASARFVQGDAGELFTLQGLLGDTERFHMALFSPPYEDARAYANTVGGSKMRIEWVGWVASIIERTCQVTNGPVFVVMAGKIKDGSYSPVVENVVTRVTGSTHGMRCGPAPYCYQRNGTPGKNPYHRRDWEPIYSFVHPTVKLPVYCDNLAMGAPPKFKAGGPMSNRGKDDQRAVRKAFTQPTIANPGNVIKGPNGGGRIGAIHSHEGEAPFAEWMVEYLIRSYTLPGWRILDPMSGSGTVPCVAMRLGRHGVGLDIRRSQCVLGYKRATVAPV